MADVTSGGLSTSDLYYRSNAITTTTAIQGKSTSDLTMDDFMSLMVAQMTNQDLFSSGEGGGGSSNTDYIAQMAQFAALQGIQTIQEYQLSSYASSYAGKNVVISQINEQTGDLEHIQGNVEGVTFYDGKPKVIVGGVAYDLYKVMEITDGQGSYLAMREAEGYIGKTVKIASEDENGDYLAVTGLVTGVTSKDGVACVIVNGVSYPASNIISIEKSEDA